jgi:hypothetical protein
MPFSLRLSAIFPPGSGSRMRTPGNRGTAGDREPHRGLFRD